MRDELKTETAPVLLKKVRMVLKKLPASNILAVVKRRAKLVPVIDMLTRWRSTQKMPKCSVQLKPVVMNLGMQHLTYISRMTPETKSRTSPNFSSWHRLSQEIYRLLISHVIHVRNINHCAATCKILLLPSSVLQEKPHRKWKQPWSAARENFWTEICCCW